jgi:hypothetical protein
MAPDEFTRHRRIAVALFKERDRITWQADHRRWCTRVVRSDCGSTDLGGGTR